MSTPADADVTFATPDSDGGSRGQHAMSMLLEERSLPIRLMARSHGQGTELFGRCPSATASAQAVPSVFKPQCVAPFLCA